MKFKTIICFPLLICMSITGCKHQKNEEKVDSFYDNLYKTTYVDAFKEKIYTTNKALYGYMKNTSQGYNSWYYLSNESNDEKQMIFDSSKESFVYGEVFIKNEFCYSKNNINVIRRFISNIEGLATIYGNPKLANLNDKKAEIKIIINGEEVFKTTIDEGDLIGKYIETNYQLKVGDIVDFVVKSEDSTVNFSPVITLDNSQKSSLYHKNDFGKFYGDVFPWYNEEEHRLYMWYLWSDNCNFTYNHCIDLSDNLIKMAAYPEENNFNLYDKYRHNYRYNEVFDVSRFIDSENYPVGVRDNMLYKDEENKRYLLIAGCYRSFDVNWDSDLNIYVSKDPFALEWNTKPNKVHAGYVSHLPECPSLLKIKNRWYPFVSVSHVTAHQIGGLQYWLGDENVDCMDIDWSKKKIYWLDGEDLCAARPTQIGDKTYMWGWITSDYKSVPLAPWAGYLNLPREIVTRSDGTLGGRMDPGLQKYINYGRLFENNHVETDSSSTSIASSLNRTFTTFDVDMKTSNNVSINFIQNGEIFTCSIEKENGKTYMRVRSINDKNHPLNSSLEIYHPSKDNKYTVKIVNDGGIIEFFVNDDNALTAKTKMDETNYDIAVSSNKKASFSKLSIHKLRGYADAD